MRAAEDLRLVDAGSTNSFLQMTDGGRVLGDEGAAVLDDLRSRGYRLVAGGLFVALPPLIVRFGSWFVVSPQILAIPPAGAMTLRMTIKATATEDEALDPTKPVHYDIKTPTFAWIPTPEIFPSNESGIGYGQECEYYWYLMQSRLGRISSVAAGPFLITEPPFLAADPP